MDPPRMRRFWDSRADENPLYYIDNVLDYRDPDVELFFERGRKALEEMLGAMAGK